MSGGKGVVPVAAKRSRTVASVTILPIAAFTFSTTSFGTPLGA